MIKRPWAFWRRVQYLSGLLFVFVLISSGVYLKYLYEPASCYDGSRNGTETGIDCGGSCARICSVDVLDPLVLWARAFRVTDGQFNAVAYIENKNLTAGIPQLNYTFSLYDSAGLITEVSGTTILPPDSTYPVFAGRINTGTRIPTQTFLKLEEEPTWLPAALGREQFTVVGRELLAADSAPRLNATIRNEELTDARDVEIIATIFDARRNALTSSRTVVPVFRGRETQDVVFTWPEPIAKTIRSCEVPTDVVLAIDLSGSMNDDGGTPPEPVTSVLAAAEAFIERLNQGDQAGVVTYATDALVREELTNNTNAVSETVANLSIAKKDETGSTNTGDAIKRAEAELESSRHNANARKVLVLLTDGLANAPGDEPEQYAIDAAASIKASDVEVFTIGLGQKVNEAFLSNIASSDDHYFKAASAGTIDGIYRSVTEAICEDGAAVIEIIPKTEASFVPLQ